MNTTMPQRVLGKTGEKVSLIGLGGWHIGFPRIDENTSIRLIHAAIERGVTFMDNAWDYNDGNSERRMGKALKGGKRTKVFLMTKIDGRTKQEAVRQLEESLSRLQVETIDLVQHHEVIRIEDPHRIFDADGAHAALIEARRAGKIRYIGFTGHKDPRIHLDMLRMASEHGCMFDTVQMPLNVMDAHYRSFEKVVLPKLVRDNIGVLAMKSMANGIILHSKTVTPVECLHYTMNLPVSTVITGIDSMELLDQACEAARTFHPMSPQAVSALLSKTAKAASRGQYEPFKTSSFFDSTAANPAWLGGVPAHLELLTRD